MFRNSGLGISGAPAPAARAGRAAGHGRLPALPSQSAFLAWLMHTSNLSKKPPSPSTNGQATAGSRDHYVSGTETSTVPMSSRLRPCLISKPILALYA